MPKTPEQKAMMLQRLKAGKEAKAKARAEAKANGLPDPHPRKPRAKKVKSDDLAVPNPLADKPTNDTVRPIDGATKESVTAVAPTEALPVESKPIDVPNLPEDKAKVVKPLEKPVAKKKAGSGTDSTGKPPAIVVNDVLKNMETGNEVIPAQFPKQKESIKKLLKENKKLKTESPAPVPNAPDVTVQRVKYHIADVKAVERQGKPFSFQAMRALLYQ